MKWCQVIAKHCFIFGLGLWAGMNHNVSWKIHIIEKLFQRHVTQGLITFLVRINPLFSPFTQGMSLYLCLCQFYDICRTNLGLYTTATKIHLHKICLSTAIRRDHTQTIVGICVIIHLLTCFWSRKAVDHLLRKFNAFCLHFYPIFILCIFYERCHILWFIL